MRRALLGFVLDRTYLFPNMRSELAHEVGISAWGRVPALGVDPTFIGDLADAVLEALPHTGAMAPPASSASGSDRALVPLGSVEDLLATYDGERLKLPPPIVVWRWGWTRNAEVRACTHPANKNDACACV